jgi:hypothetical protein
MMVSPSPRIEKCEKEWFLAPSGPEGYGVLGLLRTEVFCAIFRDRLWRVLLAAEHIDEGPVGILCEMARYQRGLDELSQRVSLHLGVGSEAHHDGVSESLHLDVIAEVDGEFPDIIAIPDLLGIAIMKVYGHQ